MFASAADRPRAVLLPSQRYVERLYLSFSPLWMAVIAYCMLTHCFARWGDLGHLLLGFALSLPLWILPLLRPPEDEVGQPLWLRHSFKANLFIALMSFVQCYFGSAMFFDGLGMEYHFPTQLLWNRTPLFLYFVTVAYFSTYYALMRLGLRLFLARVPNASATTVWAMIALLSYSMAFGETFFMASESLRSFFSYANRHKALLVGSICYGTLFLVSLPVFLRLDADPRAPTPTSRLFWQTMGANLVILCAYEVYKVLLPLW
jgi:cycloeucalenol cycloisomerase